MVSSVHQNIELAVASNQARADQLALLYELQFSLAGDAWKSSLVSPYGKRPLSLYMAQDVVGENLS